MTHLRSKRIKVLVVDDSGFFRRRITEILESDPFIVVVSTAANGEEAAQKVAALQPDVVTMDVEMPVLDGISAVRRIMERTPTPILMFSALTQEGARSTLDALEAGALDFVPKNFRDISKNKEDACKILCARVRAIAGRRSLKAEGKTNKSVPTSLSVTSRLAGTKHSLSTATSKIIVVGASTGGPAALQSLFSALPEQFPIPIIAIQHMPASFTGPFAERLDRLCRLKVLHAQGGEALRAGTVYLAPGGCQLEILNSGAEGTISIKAASGDEQYKPSIDITLRSAASAFGSRVLGIILTGMGSDGTEGARVIKEKGGKVWAQDKESSVIYGMPMSVAEAGLVDKVMSLDEIATGLMNTHSARVGV